MRNYLILSLVIIMQPLSAQDIDFTISLGEYKSDTIVIQARIVNKSNQPYLIYKPTKEAICMGALALTFVSRDNKTSSKWFPCDGLIDLDDLQLIASNSVLLNPQEGFLWSYNVSLTEISPFLSSGLYRIVANIDLTTLNMTGSITNVILKKKLSSNVIGFKK